MKKILSPSVILVFILFISWKGRHDGTFNGQEYKIAFYNIENLFDTINDPAFLDDDFTPEGKYHWNTQKLNKKIQNIARVISSIAPDFIGLAEIENRAVCEQLISSPLLAGFQYSMVHAESPDPRGIDVVFLYRKNVFSVTATRFIKVSTSDTAFNTRDILMAEGVLKNGDTVCFFVNHWPSRRGGTELSEPKRLAAAVALKNTIQEYCTQHHMASIIILGDFNDNPVDHSIKEVLQADSLKEKENCRLFNPMLPLFCRYHYGSLYYKGKQDLFDQIILSANLATLNGGKEKVLSQTVIYKPEWIFNTNSHNEKVPWRTYDGEKYEEGFSDHCPVFIQVRL